MIAIGRRLRSILLSSRTYLRQVYLLLGSALVLAFGLVDVGVLGTLASIGASLTVLLIVGIPVIVIPPVLLGLVSAVRQVEGVAVASLLGVDFPDGAPGPATTWPQRRRTSAWFLLHLIAGLIAGVALTMVLPLGILALVVPFADSSWWYVPAGLGMLVGALAVCIAVGAAVAALAPRFLGPSAEDRFEALERRAARLSERTRLARELHDGVGHALSLVVVQAGAARKVRESDPAFVAGALDAVEEAARTALTDLDQVLGLLRDEESGNATEPRPIVDLRQLDVLIATTRRAGLNVEIDITGDLHRVPAVVSRESYRIIQETLTNALRHATSPVTIWLEVRAEVFVIEVDNPLASRRRRLRAGRGLRGMRERAVVLGGELSAGEVGGSWRVRAELPLPREERP